MMFPLRPTPTGPNRLRPTRFCTTIPDEWTPLPPTDESDALPVAASCGRRPRTQLTTVADGYPSASVHSFCRPSPFPTAAAATPVQPSQTDPPSFERNAYGCCVHNRQRLRRRRRCCRRRARTSGRPPSSVSSSNSVRYCVQHRHRCQ